MPGCVASAVEPGHQLAVGGAGGGKVIAPVLEFEFQVDDLLFEGGDPGLEPFGVAGAADAGLAPDLLAQDLAEAGFEAAGPGREAAGPGREADGAGIGGDQVGLESVPVSQPLFWILEGVSAGCTAEVNGPVGEWRCPG
ncbi:hypothetical protein [Streptomyces sp. NPDC002187]|uniref:hypothetical protein n=1 Tax=Streptomyces sp. NPDC002187 TaxID=3364637 RepID=UPI0036BB29DE